MTTLKKLVFFRDEEAYASWWAALSDDDKETLGESLAEIPDSMESDTALQRLTNDIFQDFDGAAWLRVKGLRAGVEPTYQVLDIEPAYDGEGMRDGVHVVVHLHVSVPTGPSQAPAAGLPIRDPRTSEDIRADIAQLMSLQPEDNPPGGVRDKRVAALENELWLRGREAAAFLRIQAYVEKPWGTFAPTDPNDPSAAIAEIVDIALSCINYEIADRDKFTSLAREVTAN